MVQSPDPNQEAQIDYHAGLLRLWREGAGGAWRVSLQPIGSAQRLGFADLEQLFAYLRHLIGDTPDGGDTALTTDMLIAKPTRSTHHARSHTRPSVLGRLRTPHAGAGPLARPAAGAGGLLAQAASPIVVNDVGDDTTGGNSNCTLREAITNANNNSDTTGGDCAAGSGADTITFSVSGTITLGSTLPAINDEVID